jgi:hypothetical protein
MLNTPSALTAQWRERNLTCHFALGNSWQGSNAYQST